MRWVSYVSAGIFVLSFLIIICYRRTIQLVIAIMDAASDFVRQVECAVFVPVFIYLFIIAYSVGWVVVALYLYLSLIHI